MKRFFDTASNENGFVLATSMLFMVVLTIIGIAGTTTTSIEFHIAGNERTYKENFYNAEGSVFEAVQRIENEEDPDQLRGGTTSHIWLNNCSDLHDTGWDNDGQGGTVNSTPSVLGTSQDFEAFDGGVAGGVKASSLKITSSAVHEYAVYGRSRENNGQVIIEAGFKKRF